MNSGFVTPNAGTTPTYWKYGTSTQKDANAPANAPTVPTTEQTTTTASLQPPSQEDLAPSSMRVSTEVTSPSSLSLLNLTKEELNKKFNATDCQETAFAIVNYLCKEKQELKKPEKGKFTAFPPFIWGAKNTLFKDDKLEKTLFLINVGYSHHWCLIEKNFDENQYSYVVYQSWLAQFKLDWWLGKDDSPANVCFIQLREEFGNGKKLTQKELENFIESIISVSYGNRVLAIAGSYDLISGTQLPEEKEDRGNSIATPMEITPTVTTTNTATAHTTITSVTSVKPPTATTVNSFSTPTLAASHHSFTAPVIKKESTTSKSQIEQFNNILNAYELNDRGGIDQKRHKVAEVLRADVTPIFLRLSWLNLYECDPIACQELPAEAVKVLLALKKVTEINLPKEMEEIPPWLKLNEFGDLTNLSLPKFAGNKADVIAIVKEQVALKF